MTKYINADLLRKEIKRLEKTAHKSALDCADSETRKLHEGKDCAYQHVGILIDSLQQDSILAEFMEKAIEIGKKYNYGFGPNLQQSEVDLEKEIEAYFKDWSMNSYDAFFNEDGYKVSMLGIKNIARHFAQWGAEHAKK